MRILILSVGKDYKSQCRLALPDFPGMRNISLKFRHLRLILYFGSLGCSALFAGCSALDPWRISPEFSAARALSIIAVLRVLGLVDGHIILNVNTDIAKPLFQVY
jgi:hypothetical protein